MTALLWAGRRLLIGIAGVVVALTLVFLGAQYLADPVRARLGPDAPAEQVDALRNRLGLDQPLPVQAFTTAAKIVRGDFGASYQLDRPAADVVGTGFANTVTLAAHAVPISLITALVLGLGLTIVEIKFGRRIAEPGMLALAAIPGFVAAVLAVQIFSVQLGLTPPSGTGALPLAAAVLGVSSGLQMALLLSDRVHELSREPYVLAALSRGASVTTVVRRELVRPASVQLLSFLTLEVGYLLGGALVVETVFGYPGVGQLAVRAAEFRDLPILLAAATISAASFLAVRFVGDLGLVALDPRVRDGLVG